MDPIIIGIIIAVTLVLVLGSGIPVAFGLGIVSITALFVWEGPDSLAGIAETFYAGLAEFTLVSIPMFIVMGAVVASSPAGKDLYTALDRWLNKVPGGLILSNLDACSIFAALSGSSPATCAAIGKMGIPEMRQRGVPDGLATGSIAAGGTLGILIPPSITMIVYGVATETSIGRLFLAGLIPGFLLTMLFMAWSVYSAWRRDPEFLSKSENHTWGERFAILPRVLPFLGINIGVLYVLYGGVATPSEAAGVGALLCLIVAIVVYKLYSVKKIWTILSDSMKESVMILMIIGASALFSYTLSSLFVTQ